MSRGVFTEELGKKYSITKKELRLIPYFQYLLVNNSSVDPKRIDSEERMIFQKWRDEGKITFSSSSPCTCTKEFWDFMNNILWDSYVPKSEDFNENN